MSNAKPRPVAEINLEEFERRLRAAAAPQAGVEDPLAELTRLVDSIGFERSASERALEQSRAARPAPTPPPRAESKPELRLAPPPEAPKPPPEAYKPPPPPAPPQITAPPPVSEPPPPPLAAEEAKWEEAPPLRDAEPALRPSFQAEDLDSFAFDPPTPSEPEPVAAVGPTPRAAEEPARARNWGLKVGGLVAAGVLMIGAVVVFKVGGAGHSGAPPLILASTAPTKVAPPNQETIRTANESGSLLTRDTAQPTPTPPKLVDPPEAPVDLSARPQPSASPAESAATPATSAPPPAASASADASPVAPSTETPIVAAAAPKATPVSPVGADPSRVKTISVRPDGTLIASGYESAQVPLGTTPAPAQTPDAKTAEATDVEASTPAVALPTKLAPPKSAARVVNKLDTTAPADPGAGPVPVKPKKPKPTPAPVADAEPKTDDATALAPSGGGYAVQLAAPKSESEAKALIRSLPGRYSAALAGASLGVRKAERDGEAIYRVRALGLSKDEAKAMCAKVKSAGGDCYVAKN